MAWDIDRALRSESSWFVFRQEDEIVIAEDLDFKAAEIISEALNAYPPSMKYRCQ